MRVSCSDLEQFLENLRTDPKTLQNRVYSSITYRPYNTEKGLEEATKVSVVFQAHAVVLLGEQGEYLLQVGVDCGFDYRDSEPETKGTDYANRLKEELNSFCNEIGLTVLPGVVDI